MRRSRARRSTRSFADALVLREARNTGAYSLRETADEPPRYGIVKNIATYNPVRIACHEWVSICRDLSAAPSLRGAFLSVFGPPGWRADGHGLTSKRIRAGIARFPEDQSVSERSG